VALGAPTGAFGHIPRPTEFAQPYFDTIRTAAIYPSFHVIAGLAPLSGARCLATETSLSRDVASLAVRDGARTILWLANLTEHPVALDLPPELAGGGRISLLDAGSFEALTTQPDYLDRSDRSSADPLVLDAYAVARITA
jgi:hypothetical protein